MSVIAVVGDGMVGTPGISARVFAALESGGINVVAIAQGSSERNISFVVAGADAAEAARRVHARLSALEDWRRPPAGQAAHRRGAARIRARRAARCRIRSRPAADRDVRIVGLLDRSGYVFDARGIGRARACCGWRATRTRAHCSSSLGGRQGRRRADALSVMAEPRSVAPGGRRRDQRRDRRPAAGRRSIAASTWCSPTRSHWPGRATTTTGWSRRRPRPGGGSATRPRSAPGCRSSIRSASSRRPAIACSASTAASAAR